MGTPGPGVRFHGTSNGYGFASERGDTAKHRKNVDCSEREAEQSTLYYETRDGWRGYWDTDGCGGLVFVKTEPLAGVYGTDASEVAQMRRDAPPADEAVRLNGYVTGGRYTRDRATKHQKVLDAIAECGGAATARQLVSYDTGFHTKDSIKLALLEMYRNGYVDRDFVRSEHVGQKAYVYRSTGKPLPRPTLTANDLRGITYRAQVIDYLCQSEHATVRDVAEYVGCCTKRARIHLHKLVDEGLVECTESGARSYWWVA